MRALLDFLVLPEHISSAEARNLDRMNRIARRFFAAHIPVMALVAALSGGSVLKALTFTSVVAAGPLLADRALENPRYKARFSGFTAMVLAGLLVHFNQGPMQIEMHFYFFVLIAMLAAFCDPLVIVIAALTVVGHHLLLFAFFPRSVFNYDATLWAVAIHAGFVVVETAAISFVARSFFDRVIGLERIVDQKTTEIAARALAKTLILDNVEQGFVMIGPDGKLPEERSRVLDRWLGASRDGDTLWSYLARSDDDAATWVCIGWESLFDGVLPVDLAIDQLPKRMRAAGRTFAFGYRMTKDSASTPRVLVMLSDISSEVERERAERQKDEVVSAIDWMLRDRAGFLDFLNESSEIVERIGSRSMSDDEEQRLLHTLKGNASTFGFTSLAEVCHDLESLVAEDGAPLDDAGRSRLEERFSRTATPLRQLVERRDENRIEMGLQEHAALITAVRNGATTLELVRMLDDLRLEPLDRRLARMGKQAEDLALRLGKTVDVVVECSSARLEVSTVQKVWPSLVHLVRNALDHGIETDLERVTSGKKSPACLALRVKTLRDAVVFELEDDGRGIDWERVAEKAAARGLPCEGRVALEEALFTDGLSTKSQPTDISGRGVGMAAVRDAVQGVGGSLKIDSKPGRGTRFSVLLPRPVETSSAALRVTRKPVLQLRVGG